MNEVAGKLADAFVRADTALERDFADGVAEWSSLAFRVAYAVLNMRGGTWNRDGTIVFSSSGRLQRVSAEGGDPEPISTLDVSLLESSHEAPYFLPGGRSYLYLAWS